MRRILKVFAANHYDPYELSNQEIIAIWREFEPDWINMKTHQLEPMDLSTFPDED